MRAAADRSAPADGRRPAPRLDSAELPWPNADSTASSASWASTRSSRPPTGTSARRSTTRSGLVASLRARPHAGGVRHHRLHLLPDRRHLRRGDGDVPGGGRLVELRPPRLQRVLVLLRRLGPDAQLHDHDRHLGVLRAALPRRAVLGAAALARPATSSSASASSSLLCAVNVVGVKESAGREHRAGRHRLPHPAAARARRRSSSSSRPRRWSTTSTWASRRPGRTSSSRSRSGMIAYTGHRDDLEHGRGGRATRRKTIPAAIKRVVIAVFAIYAHAAGRRAVGAAGLPATPTGEYVTQLGLPRGAGRLRRRPDPRRRQADRPRASSRAPGEIYVGLLAATILFIATNAGIIGVSRLVYSMGLHRQVPDRLRQLHPRYGTPWIGILRLRRRSPAWR